MVLLELKNLVKAFGGLKAVNNVSFQVEKGEIFGLIGPNGSGKTTIFNCINNFYPITAGEVLFKGRSIGGLKTHKVCHLGIGRTFQVVKPLARLSVMDNVTASAFCRVNSIREAKAEAEGILDFTNLRGEADKPAKSLPIAGRKRLEIARALATKPELLLLDETAAGLNPSELDEAIDLIKKIRESGITILIVEHIMKVIMTISDRIHAINFGQTIAEGTPKQVANNQAVIEAYLGEEYAQS
ncbi:MAG: ABC transporter ATP-binding protein [Desulfobacteraceae bacterium]|nr:MAG: ABC transporter ATP-binding protein [Desulfobacteraceae bacterium]